MTKSMIELDRPLVLATASEARRKLVSDIGLSYIAGVVEIDEAPKEGELVSDYVARLAIAKAEKVVPPSPDAIVIAVDTAIGIGDEIIGKPADESCARKILARLSGRSHEVLSAIALRDAKAASIDLELTRTVVEFEGLTKEAIEWYAGTREWVGRAGAYAIQGKGAALVKSVHGCFTNVIGISAPTLLKMLQKYRAAAR